MTACSDDPETAPASLDMTESTEGGGIGPALPIVPEHCSRPGVQCVRADELSIKLHSVYVTQDIATNMSNVGETRAVYGNPGCKTRVDSQGITNPDFSTCALDLGLVSETGRTITSAPIYIDLAKSASDVRAALMGGRFAVPVNTYKFLRIDMGMNAVNAPSDGTQDTLPTGAAMNFRFFTSGMSAPYEVRYHLHKDVAFSPALVVQANQELVVALQYDLTGVVYSMPPGTLGAPADGLCTPPQGDPAKVYCISPVTMGLTPSVVLVSKVGKWDAADSLWDSPSTLWGP